MSSVTGFNAMIPNVTPGTNGLGNTRAPKAEPGFREALDGTRENSAKAALSSANALKFSNHAIDRMRSRGISFDPGMMDKIDQAIGKAASKGSKNTLLVTDNSALIVSVKDKTVVTVMDRNAMKENVFTNIDSTVMLE